MLAVEVLVLESIESAAAGAELAALWAAGFALPAEAVLPRGQLSHSLLQLSAFR
jgi:hypothetical protein